MGRKTFSALTDLRAAFGAKATGARAERMRRSPQYADGMFHNTVPTRSTPSRSSMGGILREFLFGDDRRRRRPAAAVPFAAKSDSDSSAGLHLTWYGHASTLVEIDGARVLCDPVWSERVSPAAFAGPRRLHAPPVPLRDVGRLDAVVISHDHYDHLDLATIRELTTATDAPFLVPLGVGAHLERWRVPSARIVELDWNETADVAGVHFIATPAQHFSGRGIANDSTLWASWVIAAPHHRVFYSGDTGYFGGFAEIGAQYGPFDASLIQIGAYAPHWPDIHMTPEEGVAAHIDLRGGLLVPVHWATFSLALHPWSEPADRVWREAKANDLPLAVPKPGERIDVAHPPAVDGWWQALG
ncbi:MBL fold metallo-hydrolase [Amycolatopsis jiangsuensis]|uniref:L-ascorbate metabolism protein UlaG (Beta-lactamase superfamily) n=1 Tax=Amycolatopsis jiangsuensis TaxID=1181879 RepID=A0A840IUF6_9PSEU|nr:MBL fold metallo-hydrolase [Amycolatopsis jiangsuensis]MBB4684852.1 L-ascorbate metabolism protein UlaG (beta-lactamase superfamily) [Amycolatopsis jiangsuensis]